MATILAGLLGCSDPPPPPPVVEVVDEEEDEEQEDTAGPEKTNKMPKVRRIRFEPEMRLLTTLTDVTVTADVRDDDSPSVDIDYQWYINDRKILHRTTSTLPHEEFVKGDQLQVVVTAEDERSTVSKKSGVVVVGSATPFWSSDPRIFQQISGTRVRAKDPDGDPVTYRLAGAPSGMTIDSELGVISYEGSAKAKAGSYTVTVIAEDPDKDNVQWRFKIQVASGSEGAKAEE